MLLEFTTGGYIEVYRDGAFVSRHRQDFEAVESITRHAEAAGLGSYEIRRPVTRVKVAASKAAPAPVIGSISGGGDL